MVVQNTMRRARAGLAPALAGGEYDVSISLQKSMIASLLLSLVEWQRGDLRCGLFASYINIYRFAGYGICCFDIAHADVFVQGGSGRAAGQCADLLAVAVD